MPDYPPALRAAISEIVYDPRNLDLTVEQMVDTLTAAAWRVMLGEIQHLGRAGKALGPNAL